MLADHDHGWAQHRENRHQRGPAKLLGPGRAGGAPGTLGQILPGQLIII